MRLLLTVAGVVAGVVPAWPCSVAGPRPSAHELVRRAEVIVRARVEGLANAPGRDGVLAGSATQVRFTVLDVLKGTLAAPTITFNGALIDRDDRNDRPAPYDFIRRGGRSGNCFALTYRPGAEYLLLLRRGEHAAYAQPHDLTPYWAPLAPTNEQLFGGASDPWYAWVVERLRRGNDGASHGGVAPSS